MEPRQRSAGRAEAQTRPPRYPEAVQGTLQTEKSMGVSKPAPARTPKKASSPLASVQASTEEDRLDVEHIDTPRVAAARKKKPLRLARRASAREGHRRSRQGRIRSTELRSASWRRAAIERWPPSAKCVGAHGAFLPRGGRASICQTDDTRRTRCQNEQVGTLPLPVTEDVVTPVPEGVMLEL
jgi:hypothetical protein